MSFILGHGRRLQHGISFYLNGNSSKLFVLGFVSEWYPVRGFFTSESAFLLPVCPETGEPRQYLGFQMVRSQSPPVVGLQLLRRALPSPMVCATEQCLKRVLLCDVRSALFLLLPGQPGPAGSEGW